MRAFVFLSKFIVVKILKQEVDDNLSIRVDERSPYGLSICFNDVMSPMERCRVDFYQTVVFIAQIW